MPQSKASKIRGDQKYYTGVAKEKIGEVIGSQKLVEQGKAEKLAGVSERDTASVQNGEKEKRDDEAKEQKDKIVKKSDEIMEQVLSDKDENNNKENVPKIKDSQINRVGDFKETKSTKTFYVQTLSKTVPVPPQPNCYLSTIKVNKKPKYFDYLIILIIFNYYFDYFQMATNKSPRTSPKSKGVNNKRMTEFWSKAATTREETSPPSQSHPNKQIKTKHVVNNNTPLAASVRPNSLDAFIGQQGIVGENGLLRFLIMCDKIPSMILWGPSGTGKTTLAKIIANSTKSVFKEFSGITHASDDLKKAFNDAKNAKRLIPGTKTIIFIDEIHRFNKGQQDLLLSHIESGDITLIGATTENPSFKLISTLLSRCMICKLNKLSPDEVYNILKRAIQKIQFDKEKVNEDDFNNNINNNNEYNMMMNIENIENIVTDDALRFLANMSDGDARVALNKLEIALALNTIPSQSSPFSSSLQGKFNNQISKEDIMKIFQKSHLPYDKNGDEHYNIVSAFIKSLRGSDANASLYWLGRMLNSGEDPLFIARRLIIFASEDIGVADNNALVLATSTHQACQFIGMPECEINLAHCVTYLAEASKSIRSHIAYKLVKQTIQEEYVHSVPLHLRNAPTKMMKEFGFGKEYKYNPDYEGIVHQEYLPSELKRKVFLDVCKPMKRDDDLDNYRHFYYYFDDSRFDNNDNDNVKGDNVKGDNVKGDNVKSDNVKGDNVKSDHVKSDYVKSDYVVDAMKVMKMEQ
ncbi:hypothetical protein Glove_673g38 [Diversispora epigaea]|uniref:AAA+ ATPase domain-containing protein n=1 Tax=Diversispora epigaea TaxID=1348612 RepID=A0A397G832_9GLOM|nr:hypothetical protein Glove_673g38 [Diversispora epigaea]